jgi:hypothetical protein
MIVFLLLSTRDLVRQKRHPFHSQLSPNLETPAGKNGVYLCRRGSRIYQSFLDQLGVLAVENFILSRASLEVITPFRSQPVNLGHQPEGKKGAYLCRHAVQNICLTNLRLCGVERPWADLLSRECYPKGPAHELSGSAKYVRIERERHDTPSQLHRAVDPFHHAAG